MFLFSVAKITLQCQIVKYNRESLASKEVTILLLQLPAGNR